jgi:hypothetical protein
MSFKLTEAFNVECRNKIEDEKREKTEEVEESWQICESEQDQQAIGASSSFVKWARLENRDGKWRLKAKLSTAAGSIQSRLTPAVFLHLRFLTRSVE